MCAHIPTAGRGLCGEAGAAASVSTCRVLTPLSCLAASSARARVGETPLLGHLGSRLTRCLKVSGKSQFWSQISH